MGGPGGPDDKKDEAADALRVYVALAMGPGTLAKAHEMDPKVDPALVELENVGPARGVESVAPSDVESVHPPSMVAQRVLEELSQYVRLDIAEKALEEALTQIGVKVDEAQSLDIREVFTGPLPKLLGHLISKDDFELVLENLEHALTDAHAPPIGRPSLPDVPPEDD